MKKQTFAILITLAISLPAAAQHYVPAQPHGKEFTLYFHLIDSNAPHHWYETAPAADDMKIRKDGGTWARPTNSPTDLDHQMSIVFTTTEMSCKDLTFDVNDESSPSLYCDDSWIIQTYGGLNARHRFDMNDPDPNVDVKYWAGSATPVTNLGALFDANWATAWNSTLDMWNVNAAKSDGNDVPTMAEIQVSQEAAIDAKVAAIAKAVFEDVNWPGASGISDKVWLDDANGVMMALIYAAVTGLGGMMLDAPTTVDTVTDATEFTLTDGSSLDDYYGPVEIIVYDASDGDRGAVRYIRNYTGSTKTVKVSPALPFTPEAGDIVRIYGFRAMGRGG
jgi:hypothetical protein